MKGEVWMDGRLCGGVRRRQRRSTRQPVANLPITRATTSQTPNDSGRHRHHERRLRPARWLPKSARVKLDVCKFVGERREPSPLPEGEGAISQKLQGPSERCFGNWFRQAAVSVLVTMKLWKRRKKMLGVRGNCSRVFLEPSSTLFVKEFSSWLRVVMLCRCCAVWQSR